MANSVAESKQPLSSQVEDTIQLQEGVEDQLGVGPAENEAYMKALDN